jgi:hypothetical protein
MQQNGSHPKIILLKGNGPITINSEMMELITITLSHGLIGLPLKDLRAENVYIVKELETFWEVHKTVKEKPCCFVYCSEKLKDADLALIHAHSIKYI